jgi:hypothetical protein
MGLTTDFGHDKSKAIKPYAALPADHRPILVYCGDGVSDISAARETDLLFAKKGRDLVTHCLQENVPFYPFDVIPRSLLFQPAFPCSITCILYFILIVDVRGNQCNCSRPRERQKDNRRGRPRRANFGAKRCRWSRKREIDCHIY